MKSIILSLALVSLLGVGNISTSVAQNSSIYKNVYNDMENNSTVISLYNGKNDANLVPFRQYIIHYSDNQEPQEKIVYSWDAKKKTWKVSHRYEYLHDSEGKPQTMMLSEWVEKEQAWSDEVECSLYMMDIDKELLTVNE